MSSNESGLVEQRGSSLHVTVRTPATGVADVIEEQPCLGSRELFSSNEHREQRRRRDESGVSE